MTNKKFPDNFIFGTALASYQVEGGIYNNDWTHWENKENTVCSEPCNDACKHYEFYKEDVNLLDELGIRAFRFSIEWSRVEPHQGQYDQNEINHYVDKAKLLLEKNITPIITFHHFTTPDWLMDDGLWASEKTTTAFVNYVDVMMQHLPKEIEIYNTINEPGIFSMFGYLSKRNFPPGIQNEKLFIKASNNIISAHKQSMKIIKEHNPKARVAMTHALHEWDDNDLSLQKEYIKYHMEDKFLYASEDDDYIALQTYSIRRTNPNFIFRALSWLQIKIPILRTHIYPRFRGVFSGRHEYNPEGIRTTKMGYEYRPQAILYNLYRIHSVFPDKDIFITENGIATDDDNERIEFITDVLNDIHDYLSENGKIMGYLYWSILDNFEWDLGYKMNFGLVEVDKTDYSRKPHKSEYWYGNISKTNNLSK